MDHVVRVFKTGVRNEGGGDRHYGPVYCADEGSKKKKKAGGVKKVRGLRGGVLKRRVPWWGER